MTLAWCRAGAGDHRAARARIHDGPVTELALHLGGEFDGGDGEVHGREVLSKKAC